MNPETQQTADYLKLKEKCDIVICLSHLGWNEDAMNDKVMMAKTRNIDLVLGGHSQSMFKELKYAKNLDGKSIGNDQNGKSGIYVGKLVIDMKKK